MKRVILFAAIALVSTGCRRTSAIATDHVDASTRLGASTSFDVEAPPTSSASSHPGDVADASVPTIPRGSCAAMKADAKSVSTDDGAITIYVQEDPSREDETTTAPIAHQDLCIVRAGKNPELLLEGHGLKDPDGPEHTLAGFDELLISPDRKTLYFVTAGWVVSGAAHKIDLETKKEKFLFDGQVVRVLEKGPYRGMLLASHYRLDDQHPVDSPKYTGRGVVMTIETRDGKTVRRLPDDDLAQKKILDGN